MNVNLSQLADLDRCPPTSVGCEGSRGHLAVPFGVTSKPTEPAAPMPPALRRFEVWVAAVFVGTLLVAVAAPFVLRFIAPWISPLWALPGIPLAVVTTTLATIWYTRRRTHRVKHAVQAAAGHACLACVYDLRGMGDTGACPECGRHFDVAADQCSWKRAGML